VSRVACIERGPFGRAVGSYLRTLVSDVIEVSANEVLTQVLPEAPVIIMASWRPEIAICQSLDQISHQLSRRFVPVVTEGKYLRIGPVVVPGVGSCWTCWWQRTMQHNAWAARAATVAEYYKHNDSSGPRGYLEAFALIAAARVLEFVSDQARMVTSAGVVWELDMLSRSVSIARVVGVHDCSRCGMKRPKQQRTVSEMRKALDPLWEIARPKD
jgi:bacteriocin biosynthesis cyclodehydratase domain-containing protein